MTPVRVLNYTIRVERLANLPKGRTLRSKLNADGDTEYGGGLWKASRDPLTNQSPEAVNVAASVLLRKISDHNRTVLTASFGFVCFSRTVISDISAQMEKDSENGSMSAHRYLWTMLNLKLAGLRKSCTSCLDAVYRIRLSANRDLPILNTLESTAPFQRSFKEII